MYSPPWNQRHEYRVIINISLGNIRPEHPLAICTYIQCSISSKRPSMDTDIAGYVHIWRESKSVSLKRSNKSWVSIGIIFKPGHSRISLGSGNLYFWLMQNYHKSYSTQGIWLSQFYTVLAWKIRLVEHHGNPHFFAIICTFFLAKNPESVWTRVWS